MNLIYFTIGGHPHYSVLLRACINTLIENTKDMSNTHIMVMCSEEYKKYIQNIKHINDIWIVPNSKNGIEASMKKVIIFNYPKIKEYSKVFYLDSDIVIVGDIITDIFPLITNPNVLYVYEEHEDAQYHNEKFWGFSSYTNEQISLFHEKKQGVFNCGHFGFLVSNDMIEHFRSVNNLIQEHTLNNYFYEQSFMNYYFNTRFLTTPLLNPYIYIPVHHERNNKVSHIIHVANASNTVYEKYKQMYELYKKYNKK
jgi:lipopolysaccharide biosynthesis glycosyltransferase